MRIRVGLKQSCLSSRRELSKWPGPYGSTHSYAGRAGEPAQSSWLRVLKRLGFPVGRLKTGRRQGWSRTINWEAFEPQPPDRASGILVSTDHIEQPQINCYMGYTTNQFTGHPGNLHESPLYREKSGNWAKILSFHEDKVVKFADKGSTTNCFWSPKGTKLNEVYLTVFLRRCPPNYNWRLVRMIPGLEEAQIIRPRVCPSSTTTWIHVLSDSDLQTSRVTDCYWPAR